LGSFSRGRSFVLRLLLIGLLLSGFQVRTLAFPAVRALGMGGAYTAVADDAGAVFWNPAGLMQIEERSLVGAVVFHPGEAEGYEAFIGYLEQDTGYGAGALSWYHGSRFAGPEFSAASCGEIHDFCYSLAKPAAGGVYWGGNVRYLRGRESSSSSWQSTWTGDVSVLARLSSAVRLGIAFRDIRGAVNGGKGRDAGGNLMLGLAFEPEKGVVFAVDGYDLLNRLQSRAVRMGAEFQLTGGVALRAGLQKETETNWKAWSWGAGINLADWRVEYAYLSGDYEGIHAMGIAWHF